MSSLQNTYDKVVPMMEPTPMAPLPHESLPPDLNRYVGREVAHELNNILTIIQGYAERMVMKHGENPALRADLQLISDNARRAVTVVREASPRKSNGKI